MRFIVKVGDLYSAGDDQNLVSDFNDAFIFNDDDKELAFLKSFGLIEDGEHWAQRHAAVLHPKARVCMLDDDTGEELEECLGDEDDDDMLWSEPVS